MAAAIPCVVVGADILLKAPTTAGRSSKRLRSNSELFISCVPFMISCYGLVFSLYHSRPRDLIVACRYLCNAEKVVVVDP